MTRYRVVYHRGPGPFVLFLMLTVGLCWCVIVAACYLATYIAAGVGWLYRKATR